MTWNYPKVKQRIINKKIIAKKKKFLLKSRSYYLRSLCNRSNLRIFSLTASNNAITGTVGGEGTYDSPYQISN